MFARRALRIMTILNETAAAPATPTALSYVGVELQDLALGASKAVDVPAGVADGDMLLMAVIHTAAGTVTLPAGWTAVEDMSPVADGLIVASRTASSEPASYTYELSASQNSAASIIAFRSSGGETIVVDDSAQTDDVASSTTHDCPSVTTSDVNATLVCFTAWGGFSSGGLSAPGDMTERTESSDGGTILHVMSANQESAGATGTKTVTGSQARAAKLISVALIEDV